MSLDQQHRMDLADAISATDHVLGPAAAKVVVVEYGDFECPNCKQAAPAVEILLERFADDIAFVFRHYPLQEVHPHALQAAEAAECAGSQGKFWEMYELLFDNQTHLTSEHLRDYAEQLELDVARFNEELDSHTHLQRIHANIESGKRSGVRGTPGFFVNGRIQDVSFGLGALFAATEAALKGE
jgi:protein-disulfide isomerase